MGINHGTLKILLSTLKKQQLSGNIGVFGVQGVDATLPNLYKLFKKYDIEYKQLNSNQIKTCNLTQYNNSVHQNTLFHFLGFDNITTFDYYKNEDAKAIVDLNQPIPQKYINKFDMLFDGGTFEHCINYYQCLLNTHKMLKTNGYVIHHVPINNCIDHAFYQPQPTLFHDFYQKNGYKIIESKIHIVKGLYGFKNRHYTLDYSLGDNYPQLLFGKIHFYFVAKKLTNKQSKSVIQTKYVEKFELHKKNEKKKIKKILLNLFSHFPVFFNFLLYFYKIKIKAKRI